MNILIKLGCLLAAVVVGAQPPPPEIPRGSTPLIVDPSFPSSTTPTPPPTLSCPVQACTLELIPEECREVPKFDYHGKLCDECPRWRQGCEPGDPANVPAVVDSHVSCPILACDTHVPTECRVFEDFTYRGRICQKCPIWRKGCREAERINAMTSHPGDNGLQPPCPELNCVDNNIPLECTIDQPYQYNGRTCYKCPLRSPTCSSQTQVPVRPLIDQPEVSCPLMNCPRQDGFPKECYQPEFFNYRGKICQSCPSLKLECQQFIPPRPIVDPVISEEIGRVDTSCPLVQCELIYIPEECMEIPTFEVNGRLCKGCPRHKEGCIPTMARLAPPNSKAVFLQIPPTQIEVTCPVKACPMIHIPPECREERPYQYKGLTCYDCPSWKNSCVKNSAPNLEPPKPNPAVSCPMFGCPLILIPPECREERTFQFHGKTCSMCPKWKEGCLPEPPKPNSPSTNTGTPTQLPVDNNVSSPSEIACPQMPCPRILIPPECREEQPYNYNGKTCYRCPKWKDGCLGRGPFLPTGAPPRQEPSANPSPTTDSSSLAVDNRNITNILKAANEPSISDLKETIPLRSFLTTVHRASCPPLRCPSMVIPLQCREESTYQFQGRKCRGCPRWRLGCDPMTGHSISSNPNGLLSFSLFNELFHR